MWKVYVKEVNERCCMKKKNIGIDEFFYGFMEVREDV